MFENKASWSGLLALVAISLSVLATTGAMATVLPKKASDHTIFTTGYDGAINTWNFNPPSTLTKKHLSVNQTGTSPSWLEFSYSVKNKVIYSADESAPGRVFAFSTSSDGQLSPLGSSLQIQNGTSTGGDGPVAIVKGRGPSQNCIFVANYNSGTASVLKVSPKDGSLSASNVTTDSEGNQVVQPLTTFQFTRGDRGVGPVADRQDHSYAHQVVVSPDGKFVYVADLGADRIHILSTKDGCDSVEVSGEVVVPDGSGPRHLAFWPPPTPLGGGLKKSGKVYAYLTSELANTLTAFEQNPKTGELTVIGEPTLATPAGEPQSGEGILPTNRTTAEVAVSKDGRFVYVSERGDMVEDHISIFSRDVQDGSVQFQKWLPSGGRMPRHFSLSTTVRPSGPSVSGLVSDIGSQYKTEEEEYVAIAHQTEGNLVIMKRDVQTGDLEIVAKADGVTSANYAGFSPF
ncbi:putative isomerase YbhE [Violaceomyces palustris]|uniref:Isomerase YbhE n=1 Tax=Violaceomyces palustris TaxID=1673888 RepID=A0ACD0NLT7_9BASI|nr:putative isomerase YbhE [Violaceomyces palustris]